MTQASAEMVEKLRELLARATPGPWMVVEGDIWEGCDADPDGPDIPLFRKDRGVYRHWGRKVTQLELEYDAALIVEAVNALPSLLARIEKLEAENGRLREALEPFAALADERDRWLEAGSTARDSDLAIHYGKVAITMPDYRRARAALKGDV